VSQAVVARHPVTRSLHDGIVLTTKPSRYRVQFNRCAAPHVHMYTAKR
jgi:hypothetical protein